MGGVLLENVTMVTSADGKGSLSSGVNSGKCSFRGQVCYLRALVITISRSKALKVLGHHTTLRTAYRIS